MNEDNIMHLKLTVGNEVKVDEDTDLFACIYSSEEKVERLMMLRCDYLTLAEGSIELDNLYHSFLRTLKDTLGDKVTGKLIEYIRHASEL